MGSQHLFKTFLESHPEDAARVMGRARPEDAATLLTELPPNLSAQVVGAMTSDRAADCLDRMSLDRAAQVVGALPVAGAAALLRRLETGRRASMMAKLPGEVVTLVDQILRHPDGTAGAMMDPDVVVLLEEETVGHSTARLRRAPGHLPHYLYVVDRSQALTGVVDGQMLLVSPARARIVDLMQRHVARLRADMERPAILVHPAWRDYHALPVVDRDQRLLGVLRYQTFRALEDDERRTVRTGPGIGTTALALSELYWVGLSGVVEGLLTAASRYAEPRPVPSSGR